MSSATANNELSPGQKAAVFLVVLPIAAFWVFIYYFSRRQLANNETTLHRMQYWYAGAAAGLFGQLLFHVIPNAYAAGGDLYMGAGIVLAGFFITLSIIKLHRVWGPSQAHAPSYIVEPRELINSQVEQEALVEIGENDDFAESTLPVADASDIISMRRITAFILFTAMVGIVGMEGLFVLINGKRNTGRDRYVTITMFWIDKLTESIAMACYIIHAHFQAIQKRRKRRVLYFGVLTVGWCLTVCLSTLPILMDVDYDTAVNAVTHPAATTLYSFCGGILFAIALHWVMMEKTRTDKREVAIWLTCFALIASVSWMTSFFF